MMDITQDMLDRAALVLLVDQDGRYEWSADKSDHQIAGVLAGIADHLDPSGRDAEIARLRAWLADLASILPAGVGPGGVPTQVWTSDVRARVRAALHGTIGPDA